MATAHRLLALALTPALLGARCAASPVQAAPPPQKPQGFVPPPGVPTYQVIQMDTLSHRMIVGHANDLDPAFDPNLRASGPIMVGGSFTDFISGEASAHSVCYFRSGAVLDLGVGHGEAAGMNSRGTIVGWTMDAGGEFQAFRQAQGSWTILPGLGSRSTRASAVNSHDIVVGTEGSWGQSKALYWTPDNQAHELATGGHISSLTDINDEGVVVGFRHSGPAFTMRLDDTSQTLLPSPFDASCIANAINDAGDVVGESQRNGAYQPVLWSHGTALLLPVLPNEDTGGGRAYDINNHGVIVGISNRGKAVLWIDGAIYDLNALTPGYAPFLTNARAINDQGVIACESESEAEGTHAVLLIPEP